MKRDKIKNKFIELRANGVSIRECAKILECSPSTLIELSRLYQEEIINARNIELEHFQKKLILVKLKNLERFESQLERLESEIENRLNDTEALKTVGLDKLMLMRDKLAENLVKLGQDTIPSQLPAYDLTAIKNDFMPDFVKYEVIKL